MYTLTGCKVACVELSFNVVNILKLFPAKDEVFRGLGGFDC